MTKWSEHCTMPIPIQWETVADLPTPAHNLENIFYQQIFLPTDPQPSHSHKQLQKYYSYWSGGVLWAQPRPALMYRNL